MIYDVIIIGAGPSGLMCLQTCKSNNINALLIEKNSVCGKKVLISGGGACNVTNTYYDISDFVNELTIPHKKFLYSTLSNFNTLDVLDFFNNLNVELVLEKSIKYFPKSKNAQELVDALTNNVKSFINLNEEVLEVNKKDFFIIKTNKNKYLSKNVVVATGSKSYPKTGSTGYGYRVAKSFKHSIIPLYPAETHVYCSEIKKHSDELMGISCKDVTVTTSKGNKYTGDLLFTHFGLSGPVIQHLSEFIYKDKGNITINFNTLTACIKDEQNKEKNVINVLNEFLPKRLLKFLLSDYKNKKCKQLHIKDYDTIDCILNSYSLNIDRVEDITRSFVNGGGVSTEELHPKSFMSKKQDGLFFTGEVVDMHGPIGGFNVTLALSSGFSAAKEIIKRSKK